MFTYFQVLTFSSPNDKGRALNRVIKTMPHVLVVDDDPAALRFLSTLLESEDYMVSTASGGVEALQELQRSLPDLVLLDLVLPDMHGLKVLARMREMAPPLKVVVMSGIGSTAEIVQAVKLGAQDYISKPIHPAELLGALRGYLKVPPPRAVHREIVEEFSADSFFLAASPVMHKLYEQVKRIAEVDVPVLLTGESGTGKEIASLLIHKFSARAQRKFMKVNCAAIPEELLESELFGFEAGAFTGATHAKPGLFELGDRGTVLLDEIAEMPTRLQAKLLQVLQEQKFFRLGSKSPIAVNVRILAATNVNIEEAIRNGRLRLDVFYRLNTFNVVLPPLRERREEIEPLFRHYVKRLAYAYKLAPRPLTDMLLHACLQHSWPGNLRELYNFVKRYLVLGDEKAMIAELRPQNAAADRVMMARAQGNSMDLKNLVRGMKEEAEAEAIAHALEQTSWNRKQTAEMLNISYKALFYKMRQYGIVLPKLRSEPATEVVKAVKAGSG
ncbi:MAG: sigma-54 dependent transcriptional regulator [Candidatus Korobacteraceae bacterium]|jgi:two-component system response regulator AtoC